MHKLTCKHSFLLACCPLGYSYNTCGMTRGETSCPVPSESCVRMLGVYSCVELTHCPQWLSQCQRLPTVQRWWEQLCPARTSRSGFRCYRKRFTKTWEMSNHSTHLNYMMDVLVAVGVAHQQVKAVLIWSKNWFWWGELGTAGNCN